MQGWLAVQIMKPDVNLKVKVMWTQAGVFVIWYGFPNIRWIE